MSSFICCAYIDCWKPIQAKTVDDVSHLSFITEHNFFHHLLQAVSSHWFKGKERKYNTIGCLFCFPPFVAMGDTFFLLVQYQHCRNWFIPLSSYNLISITLFVLTLLLFLCLCSTYSHLHLYLDYATILCTSFFVSPTSCLFPISTSLLLLHLSVLC